MQRKKGDDFLIIVALSSHRVEIHPESFFAPKDGARKLSFLHTLFLENKVQINETNCAAMLFMSKQIRTARSCKN